MLLLGLAVGGAENCRRKRQLSSGSLVLLSAVLVRGAFVVAGAAPDRRQLPLSGGELTLDAGNTLRNLEDTVSVLEVEAPVAHGRVTFMNMARGAKCS